MKGVLMGLLFMVGGTAHAIDMSKCSVLKTEIEVNTTPITFSTDYSLSLSQIQALAGTTAGMTTLGVTSSKLHVEYTIGYDGLTETNTGITCLKPKLKINLAYPMMKVYVAKEFPKGSCEFNHIYEHELKHVNAYKKHLKHIESELESKIKAFFGNRVYQGNKDALMAQFSEAVNTHWMPWVQQKAKEVDKLHQQIDTPDEYAKNTTACNGKINEKIRAFRS